MPSLKDVATMARVAKTVSNVVNATPS